LYLQTYEKTEAVLFPHLISFEEVLYVCFSSHKF
jgi:hypothetical protein